MKPSSLLLYAHSTDLFCLTLSLLIRKCRRTITSLALSPTTMKKLLFFSCTALWMREGIRGSLHEQLELFLSRTVSLECPYTCFCAILQSKQAGNCW